MARSESGRRAANVTCFGYAARGLMGHGVVEGSETPRRTLAVWSGRGFASVKTCPLSSCRG